MSSYAGLTLWSIMTVLEFVGKCVPVIDQMVDSVEVFVVPWIVSIKYTVFCIKSIEAFTIFAASKRSVTEAKVICENTSMMITRSS